MDASCMFIDNETVGSLKDAKRAVALLNDPAESHRVKFSGSFADPHQAVDLRRHAEYLPEDAVYIFDCRPWRRDRGHDWGARFWLHYRHTDRSFRIVSRDSKVAANAS